MKKITLIIALMISLCANAQMVFTDKIQTDEYEDIISYEEQRTLIEMTDSSFIIKEKGKWLYSEYIIVGQETRGSKNNVIELNDLGTYGYEYLFAVIEKSKIRNYSVKDVECIQIRYISSSKYSYIFSNMLFIITTTNGCKIVYMRE